MVEGTPSAISEAEPQGTELPLAGVKVVEVAGFVFVPMATTILADLGADVIKVEPISGEPLRRGRSGLPDADEPRELGSSQMLAEMSNRGKRSISIDLKSESGREILNRLVADADIFATSYLTGIRKKLKIDVDDIRAINPSIIYARGSGWGSLGPMRDDPAFDLVSAWAESGVAATMADVNGEPPTMPLGFFDAPAGSVLAGALGIALYRKAVHGVGSVVDTSLLNIGMWAVQSDISAHSLGIDPGKPSRHNPRDALVSWYQTADDRWIFFVLTRSATEFSELCERFDSQELASDERFVDSPARLSNARELSEELTKCIGRFTLDELEARLEGFGGVWGAMRHPHEASGHPQSMANGMIVDHSTNRGVDLKLVGTPFHFDEQPTRPAGPTPGVGEHTSEILRSLGYAEEQVEALKAEGACR